MIVQHEWIKIQSKDLLGGLYLELLIYSPFLGSSSQIQKNIV